MPQHKQVKQRPQMNAQRRPGPSYARLSPNPPMDRDGRREDSGRG